jgi:nucleoside 2-deoxyribosyltransferase
MTRVYIAGPMTGYPRWNYDAFEAAAAQLREAGYAVVSPTEIDAKFGFDPDAPVEEFTEANYVAALERDLDAIAECDGIALLPKWFESRGARAEFQFAEALGLPTLPVSLWLRLRKAPI